MITKRQINKQRDCGALICRTDARWAQAHRSARPLRRGFTLIEMMIALGLLMLMLAIIFIPLNQAFSAFRIGQARSELQQAGRQTLDQMARELRTAVRVFPNDHLPGITDQSPYANPTTGVSLPPYIQNDTVGTTDCDTTAIGDPAPAASDGRVANTARIDFIPADVDASGNVITPIRPGKFLVTYYARRVRPGDDYHPISNPVVLYRAQSPIRRSSDNAVIRPDGSTVANPGDERNVDVSANRYSPLASPDNCTDRGSKWLYQNNRGEPIAFIDGEPNTTTLNDAGTVAAVETQLSPRGLSLTLRNLRGETLGASTADLKPNSWFTPEDSNRDGKIDRVTISLSLDRIDAGTMARSNPQPDTDANPSSGNGLHRVRLPLVVDLQNVIS